MGVVSRMNSKMAVSLIASVVSAGMGNDGLCTKNSGCGTSGVRKMAREHGVGGLGKWGTRNNFLDPMPSPLHSSVAYTSGTI